jgi:hypothetical protein
MFTKWKPIHHQTEIEKSGGLRLRLLTQVIMGVLFGCLATTMRVFAIHLPVVFRPRGAVLAASALVGFCLALPSPVSAIYFGAGYYSNLEEYHGSEKVSLLSISVMSSDWAYCNGTTCNSTAGYASISWGITDGTSTFENVYSRHLGGPACAPQKVEYTVNAGPANSYGLQYVNFVPQGCWMSYNGEWAWETGMCETSGAYNCYWWPDNGPNIRAKLTPPSNSAYGFLYRW